MYHSYLYHVKKLCLIDEAPYHIFIGLDDYDNLCFYYKIHHDAAFIPHMLQQATITDIDKKLQLAFITTHKPHPINAVMRCHNHTIGQSVAVQFIKYPRGDKIAEYTSHIVIEGRYWVCKKGKPKLTTQNHKLQNIADKCMNELDIQHNVTLKNHAYYAPSTQQIIDEYYQLTNHIQQGTSPIAHFYQTIIYNLNSTIKIELYPQSTAIYWNKYAKNYQEILDNTSILPPKNHPITHYQIEQKLQELLQTTHYIEQGIRIHITETPSLCVIDIDSYQYQDTHHDRALLNINMIALRYIAKLLLARHIGGMVVIDLIKTKNHHLLKACVQHLKKMMPHGLFHCHGISKMGLLECHLTKFKPSLRDELQP